MKYPTLMDRIIANSVVDQELSRLYDGTLCWIWVASYIRGRNGAYPAMNISAPGTKARRKRQLAHRMAIIASGRSLGPKEVARHLCNNQYCVNPAHLRGGTQSENLMDQERNKKKKILAL